MHLGVILNRVFRIKDNPLFDYVVKNQEEIEKLYLILPLEDLSDAGESKQQYYNTVASGFVKTLYKHNIYPYVVSYKSLGKLGDQLGLTHVLIGKDIMSYHNIKYDFLHLKLAFQNRSVEVIGQRVNHYFQPSQIVNKQQRPYKVFTSFYKANRRNLVLTPSKHYQYKQLSQYAEKGSNHSGISLNSSEDIEQQARKDWKNFLNEDISNYKKMTDDVSQNYVSGLGKYLAYGLLDIHEIINDLLEYYENDEANYESYIREVMFREFYYILMTQYPETATKSFTEKYRNMQWSYNKQNFDAWKTGKTGFPIIDAAMQKLNRTGYMHNRLRMVVSQFLTKNLFIDWTWGEEYFRQYLIDYDNASNVHGWQWSASTGTDAAPYFRMFNPIRQSERFDAKGYFIKSQLKLFKDVSSDYIHNPSKNKDKLKENYDIEIGKDYPEMLVDLKSSREFVMNKFKNFR